MSRSNNTPPPPEPDLSSSCLSTPSVPSPITPPDYVLLSLRRPLAPSPMAFSPLNQAVSANPPRPVPQTPVLDPLTSPTSNPVSPLPGMHSLYACIYATGHCFQSYDTYDEWVQHEETAHPPHGDVYLCGEAYDDDDDEEEEEDDSDGAERCNAGFRDPDDLDEHLVEDHGIRVAHVRQLELRAVGPRTRNYWCGFCQKVIGVPTGGYEIWAMKRFTHVEEHFLGRNGPRMLIGSWVAIWMVATADELR